MEQTNVAKLKITHKRAAQELLNDIGPFSSLLREVVKTAQKEGASDIHIEPTESGLEIRIRIHGELTLLREVAVEYRESLLLEAKRLFGLAIGISGKPQDGRVSFPELKLDLRVSLLPTFYGEKIVMRLLDLNNTLNLKELNYRKEELKIFEDAIKFEDGLVIISGPTGSGKTRTLYSLLRSIDSSKYNIVTVEDPIEYRLKGINQVQVNKKLNFSDALRSILRQDPDVILVGEIRDEETAKLCFQAAATGHLVFSTVHANGAIEVVERLKNLSISELDMKSSLRLSLAQRLEQSLCQKCAIPVIEDISEKRQEHVYRNRNAEGCESCKKGVSGRVPILEWAKMDQEGNLNLEQTLDHSKVMRAKNGELDFNEVLG